jgi:hypothetical protein
MWTSVCDAFGDISVATAFIILKRIEKKRFGLTGFSVNESYL